MQRCLASLSWAAVGDDGESSGHDSSSGRSLSRARCSSAAVVSSSRPGREGGTARESAYRARSKFRRRAAARESWISAGARTRCVSGRVARVNASLQDVSNSRKSRTPAAARARWAWSRSRLLGSHTWSSRASKTWNERMEDPVRVHQQPRGFVGELGDPEVPRREAGECLFQVFDRCREVPQLQFGEAEVGVHVTGERGEALVSGRRECAAVVAPGPLDSAPAPVDVSEPLQHEHPGVGPRPCPRGGRGPPEPGDRVPRRAGFPGEAPHAVGAPGVFRQESRGDLGIPERRGVGAGPLRPFRDAGRGVGDGLSPLRRPRRARLPDHLFEVSEPGGDRLQVAVPILHVRAERKHQPGPAGLAGAHPGAHVLDHLPEDLACLGTVFSPEGTPLYVRLVKPVGTGHGPVWFHRDRQITASSAKCRMSWHRPRRRTEHPCGQTNPAAAERYSGPRWQDVNAGPCWRLLYGQYSLGRSHPTHSVRDRRSS